MSKPILSIDFDGVVHRYVTTGGAWDPGIIRDGPTPGAEAALASYLTHFDVQIFSSRSHQPGGLAAMQNWCQAHFPSTTWSQLGFPLVKPPAMLSLDDRALTFTGTWPDLTELRAFRPWNRK